MTRTSRSRHQSDQASAALAEITEMMTSRANPDTKFGVNTAEYRRFFGNMLNEYSPLVMCDHLRNTIQPGYSIPACFGGMVLCLDCINVLMNDTDGPYLEYLDTPICDRCEKRSDMKSMSRFDTPIAVSYTEGPNAGAQVGIVVSFDLCAECSMLVVFQEKRD